MKPASISVVIPAFNAAHTLRNALESALSQTVPPKEILVVDDGSRDETVQIATAFREVRVISQENGGPGSARNRGIRAAQGDWIAFLDADDTWLPSKLERQTASMVGDAVGLIQSRGDTRAARSAPDRIDFNTLWTRNCITTSTVLARRKALLEVGLFHEERTLIGVEDYHLWLRLTHAGWQGVTCPEQLHRYTPTESSLSRQVERFVQAELYCARSIAAILSLPEALLKAKRAAICEEYGRDLLHVRDFEFSRKLLSQACREGANPRRVFWYLASWAPSGLLNLPRTARTWVAH